MDETERRRAKQIAYNTEHQITPTTVTKTKDQVFAQTAVLDIKGYDENSPLAAPLPNDNTGAAVAEDQGGYVTIPQWEKHVAKLKKMMERAAKDLDFMEAARLRDLMFEARKKLDEMKNEI
jgi:excinuclease ABC subunit B